MIRSRQLARPNHDRPGDDPLVTVAPAGADRYATRGRRLDLVAQHQSRSGDIAGYCFFPDGFRPVAAAELADATAELADATAGLLRYHREEILASAGLSSTPLHVTEHGWPTGPRRPPARQADVIDTVVRTIAAQASALSITRYTLFALRDADSGKEDSSTDSA